MSEVLRRELDVVQAEEVRAVDAEQRAACKRGQHAPGYDTGRPDGALVCPCCGAAVAAGVGEPE